MKNYLHKHGTGIAIMTLAVATAFAIGDLIGLHGKVVELHHALRRSEAMIRLICEGQGAVLEEMGRYHVKCVETAYRLDGDQSAEIRLIEDSINLLADELAAVRGRLDRVDLERKLQAMLAKGEPAADPADEPRSTIVLPDVD